MADTPFHIQGDEWFKLPSINRRRFCHFRAQMSYVSHRTCLALRWGLVLWYKNSRPVVQCHFYCYRTKLETKWQNSIYSSLICLTVDAADAFATVAVTVRSAATTAATATTAVTVTIVADATVVACVWRRTSRSTGFGVVHATCSAAAVSTTRDVWAVKIVNMKTTARLSVKPNLMWSLNLGVPDVLLEMSIKM